MLVVPASYRIASFLTIDYICRIVFVNVIQLHWPVLINLGRVKREGEEEREGRRHFQSCHFLPYCCYQGRAGKNQPIGDQNFGDEPMRRLYFVSRGVAGFGVEALVLFTLIPTNRTILTVTSLES